MLSGSVLHLIVRRPTLAHRYQPMTMRNLLVLCSFSFLACSGSAQYQGPESVEYDAANDRYLVSNTQSSTIKARSQSGTVTDFASGFGGAPYGLEIMGDVLYACVGGGIRGFDLATGQQVYTRSLGGTFNNGITSDGQFLYVTDFSAQRIYKVDPVADTHSTLVPATAGTPNGIVWDPVGQRLITVFWGSNAPIKAFDRNTGTITTLVANTGLGNIDGVTIDCFGNVLIASWSPARITSYLPTFDQPGVNLGVAGLSNPADIDFDEVNKRICIPNSGNNTVTLVDVACTAGMQDALDKELRVFPNPATNSLRVEGAAHNERYELIDMQGRVVASGSLGEDGLLDISGLLEGNYMLHLSVLGLRTQVVKQ